MPSKTAKQHRLMEAVAHNPAFAKKVGIPQSVGKDFSTADKGKKFGMGGGVSQTQGGKGMVNRQETRAGSVFGQKKEVPNINLNKYIGKKEGGMAKSDMKEDMKPDVKQDKAIVKKAFKMHDKQEHKSGPGTDLSKLKKGGMAMKKMASGGETMGPRSMSKDVEKGSNKLTKFGESAVQKKGHTKGKNFGDTGPVKMRTGGKVKRYDEGGDIETETTQGENKSIGDDVRARAMAAMSKGDSDTTPAPTTKVSAPAPKPAPKSEPKAAPKSEPKATPVQQAKDVISAKGASTPKSFTAAGGNTKASPSKADVSSLGFKKPSDPLARFEQVGPKRSEQNMPAKKKSSSSSTDYSVGNAMRKGGKVGPSRGDGIAQRGRTKGKYC